MAIRFRAPLVAAALAPVALAAACSSGSPTTTPSSSASSSASAAAVQTAPAAAATTLSETGSSLVFPLFGLWAPAYHTQYSQVTINTASSSSGVGISSATAGTVDIGTSDAYLSSSEMAATPTLENIPLAVAALEVSYNVPGLSTSTNLKLNGSVLAKIFSGKITSWNDPAITALNSGVTLPSTKIVLVHRADSSGSTFLFTSYLNAQDPTDWSSSLIGTTVAWPKQAGEVGATGSGGIVTALKTTPGAISYVGVSYESKITAAKNLGQASLGNAAGSFVLPTADTINAALAGFTSTPANEAISLINGSGAQAYPIINYEYAIVNTTQSSAAKAQDIQAFLNWTITGGTSQLSQVNFQPLPASVVTLSDNQIAKIKG